ncbi:hypothetical protein QR685DRAFT_526355 [Neurospora intermedia]|uniref:Uncharacterized protein n=1 Tax=Neurospora intermedia TaxID=5142 RepID=A0ABR3D9M8_NEUIN
MVQPSVCLLQVDIAVFGISGALGKLMTAGHNEFFIRSSGSPHSGTYDVDFVPIQGSSIRAGISLPRYCAV